jgi:hypothetical protein
VVRRAFQPHWVGVSRPPRGVDNGCNWPFTSIPWSDKSDAIVMRTRPERVVAPWRRLNSTGPVLSRARTDSAILPLSARQQTRFYFAWGCFAEKHPSVGVNPPKLTPPLARRPERGYPAAMSATPFETPRRWPSRSIRLQGAACHSSALNSSIVKPASPMILRNSPRLMSLPAWTGTTVLRL